MRGAQNKNWSADELALSYALWWRDAGLHSATSDAAHGWIADPANEDVPAPAAPTLQRQRVAETAAPIAHQPAATGRMPGDLSGFLAWLAQDKAQPDAAWGSPAFLPSAVQGAKLLVIMDMPEAGLEGPDLPLAGPAARLVTAMLGAIGLPLADTSFAPLAMRRPPGGLLDDETMSALVKRMRHYLGLARPRAALILGDRTSRALIGTAGVPAGAHLPVLNLESCTMPVAALPAPELLMRRPLAKAASWQTLRLLNGAMSE